MLYLNTASIVPDTVKAIVSELVDNKITQDEARKRVLAWKETIQ